MTVNIDPLMAFYIGMSLLAVTVALVYFADKIGRRRDCSQG